MENLKREVLNSLINLEYYELADIINNSELVINDPHDFDENNAWCTLSIRVASKFYKTVSNKDFKKNDGNVLYKCIENITIKDGYHITHVNYEIYPNDIVAQIIESSSLYIQKIITELSSTDLLKKADVSIKREIINSIESFNEKKYTSAAKTIFPVMENIINEIIKQKKLSAIFKNENFAGKLKGLSDRNLIDKELFETYKIHNIRNAILHGDLNPMNDKLVLPICLTGYSVVIQLLNSFNE